MKYNKHIVWFVPGFAANEQDDTCIPPLQLFLKELVKSHTDYCISVIALHYPFKSEKYSWYDTFIYSLNGQNKSGLHKIVLWKKVLTVFKKINKEKSIDLIHSFWFSECMLVGKYLAKRYNIKHINTLMGQDVLQTNNYLKTIFLRNVFIVALFKRHADFFFLNTSHKANEIIPWGIDSFSNTNNDKSPKKYDIIAVGSLIGLKNYSLLIEIVNELKIKYPAINILIVGEGNERKKLMDSIVNYGLEDNIKLSGKVNRSEVMNLMMNSKLFVHTSTYESFGFVFLEAMKCGLPIVSFPVGLAENSDVWKIANTRNEMVEAIKYFFELPKIDSSPITYSIEEITKRYVKLYELFTKKIYKKTDWNS